MFDFLGISSSSSGSVSIKINFGHDKKSAMAKLKFPKKKTKTFDGCWSCRERGMKCDELKPHCQNCLKNSIVCKGYDIRLSWDTKKTDNLRRFKIYDHFEKRYFCIEDLNTVILEIDDLVENFSYRNLVRLPFTVFDSNEKIKYWSESMIDHYNLPWFKKFMLEHLDNENILNSIYASASYLLNNSTKGAHYRSELSKHVETMDEMDNLCWVFAMLNIILTSNLVNMGQFDYHDTRIAIDSLLCNINEESCDYKHLVSLLTFMDSLKFIKPKFNDIFASDLNGLGLTSKLLANWYQILSINCNTNLSFFKLEDELWHNKLNLILPSNDKMYHKSYTWYISMYIYFIKKFYHRHHGTVSINYLINEAIPHLQKIDYNQDFFGLEWCLFIIFNESQILNCNNKALASLQLSKLHIPIVSKNQDWIQYIESSNKILI